MLGTASGRGIWSRVINDDLQESFEPRDGVIRVDARGRHCPIPTLRLSRALRKATAGVIVELIADDPMARIDAPHFAIQAGHEVLTITETAGVMSIRVRKVVS